MSSGLKRTGRRSDATPFAGGRLPQFATVRQLDLDAARYLAAVEAADGARLEPAVRAAVNAFVVGCKADSIWTPIKASCILAGARTLSGGLVPLVGTAPTNFNFVSGDYNRRTGLLGNGSTKYLDSNRADNADPQNNQHMAAFASTVPTTGNSYLAVRDTGTYYNHLLSIGTRSRCIEATLFSAAAVGFAGLARSSSASYMHRNSQSSVSITRASIAPVADKFFMFARNESGSAVGHSNARLAFYSIGESLDLAMLDSRVTTLINAIGAAIP